MSTKTKQCTKIATEIYRQMQSSTNSSHNNYTKIATEIVNLAPTAQSMSHSTAQYTLSSVVFPLCWLPGCVAATPQSLEPPAPL